jgi:FtsP/CotA-like multicopper oxidase with cupredoxin domain
VLNASADTYVNLSLDYNGKRQPLSLVALDGAPLRYGEPGGREYTPEASHILLPPAARAEFVITGPAEGVSGQLMTSFVFRGAEDDAGAPKAGAQAGVRAGQDDVDAARPLAAIVATTNVTRPQAIPAPSVAAEVQSVPLSRVRPVRKRMLYFSERLSDPSNPNSATLFFITEDQREPVLFDPHNGEPSITVRQGEVEDWTIENRSRESHTFHIHQLHFMVVSAQGNGWEEPALRDTVNVSAWDGSRRFPSVTLRMDFRDPRIVGTIPFHCHIAQHLDGGMMGTVRIEPSTQNKEPVARDR